jgi:hypothetical protein
MKSFYSTSIISIFLFLSTNGLINGQNKIDGFSINPKTGPTNFNFNGGTIGLEINILNRHNIYSVDYYHISDYLSPYMLNTYNEIDFLIGKYIGDRFFRFQYQGGLGIFEGYKITGDYYNQKIVNFFTIGIPLKLGFKFLPAKFLSIGIDLQTNLNFQKTTVLPMLSIELGKLRNKIIR